MSHQLSLLDTPKVIRFYGVHQTEDGRFAVIAVEGPSPCVYHYDDPLSIHRTYREAQHAAEALT